MRSVRVKARPALATTLLLALASLVPPPALAQPDLAQQRARIAADRAQASTVLADRERACLTQFVAAPCRDAARNEQRASLKRLRNEEMALDEALRNESAAQRRELLAGKAAARASRTAAVDADAAQRRAQTEAASPGTELAAPASKERGERAPRGPANPPPAHAVDAGRRAALEAQNVAAFEARARAAQAHREAVALRNARRLQGSEGGAGSNAARRSAPLPTPLSPAAALPAPAAASRPAR